MSAPAPVGACRFADCWCRAWPPVRLVPSTGQLYGVEAAPYVGEPWLFRYAYFTEGRTT